MRNKARMSSFITAFNIILKVLTNATIKEIKGIQIRNREIKQSVWQMA